MLIKIKESYNTLIPQLQTLVDGDILSLKIKNESKYIVLPVKNEIPPASISKYNPGIIIPPSPPTETISVTMKFNTDAKTASDIELLSGGGPCLGLDGGSGQIFFIWPEFTSDINPLFDQQSDEPFWFYSESSEIYTPIQKKIQQTKQTQWTTGIPYDVKDWPGYMPGAVAFGYDATPCDAVPIYQNGLGVADIALSGHGDVQPSANPNINCLVQFRDQFYNQILDRFAAPLSLAIGGYGHLQTGNNGASCFKTPPTDRPYAECTADITYQDDTKLTILLNGTGSYDPYQFVRPVIVRGDGFPVPDINQLYFVWAIFGVDETGQHPVLTPIRYVRNDNPLDWNNTQLIYRDFAKWELLPYKKLKVLLKVYVYRESVYITSSDGAEQDENGCLVQGVLPSLTKQASWAWTTVDLPWA